MTLGRLLVNHNLDRRLLRQMLRGMAQGLSAIQALAEAWRKYGK